MSLASRFRPAAVWNTTFAAGVNATSFWPRFCTAFMNRSHVSTDVDPDAKEGLRMSNHRQWHVRCQHDGTLHVHCQQPTLAIWPAGELLVMAARLMLSPRESVPALPPPAGAPCTLSATLPAACCACTQNRRHWLAVRRA